MVARHRHPGLPAAALAAVLLAISGVVRALDAEPAPDLPPGSPYRVGELLFSDDFAGGTGQWTAELEKGGTVQARDGKLVIDVPAGCTCWFQPVIEGTVLIQYDATVIKAGGANDRLSDLNCFWMAHDPHDHDGNVPAAGRRGGFPEYDTLRAYYVGLGGNDNTTTRLRRYVGEAGQRPLLPEHDLRDPRHLLTANVRQSLRLVAAGSLVQFYRDGERLFELNDGAPYTRGWFAFRTVGSHLEIERFRVYRLHLDALPPAAAASATPSVK